MQSTAVMVRVAGVIKSILSIYLLVLPLGLMSAPTAGDGGTTTPPPVDDDARTPFDNSLLAPGPDGAINPFIYIDQADLLIVQRFWGLYDGRNRPVPQFEFSISETGTTELYAETFIFIGSLTSLLEQNFSFEISLQFATSQTEAITIKLAPDKVRFDIPKQQMILSLERSQLPANLSNMIGLIDLNIKEIQDPNLDVGLVPANWHLGALARLSISFPPITNVHNGANGDNQNFDSAVDWNGDGDSGAGIADCGLMRNRGTTQNSPFILGILLSLLSFLLIHRSHLKRGEQ